MSKKKSITVITSWDDTIVCTMEAICRIGLTRDGNRMGSMLIKKLPHEDDDKGILDLINEIEFWMIENEF